VGRAGAGCPIAFTWGIGSMAHVDARMVKELREKTGAPMMECKAALSESAGDMEAAVDWLRKKGVAKAAKKAGRVAAEGLIGVALAQDKGVVVEVNSETDFVARNDFFQGLVKMIAQAALDAGVDVDAIRRAPVGDESIGDAISSAIATVGENVTLRRAAALAVARGIVASYVHNQVGEGLGRIGVLVALESAGDKEELALLGRNIAMHIASQNPQAVDVGGLESSLIAREKAILADKFKAQGKPENMIERIVESGLKSLYKEICLIDQAYIRDPGKSVAQVLKEAEAGVGAPIKIGGFVRFALGEGIDKHSAVAAHEGAVAMPQPR
jgi:elongation factor Ts